MDPTLTAVVGLFLTSTVVASIVTHLLSKRTREVTEAAILVKEYREFIVPLKEEIKDLRDEVEQLRRELKDAVNYIRDNGHDWPTPPDSWLKHLG